MPPSLLLLGFEYTSCLQSGHSQDMNRAPRIFHGLPLAHFFTFHILPHSPYCRHFCHALLKAISSLLDRFLEIVVPNTTHNTQHTTQASLRYQLFQRLTHTQTGLAPAVVHAAGGSETASNCRP